MSEESFVWVNADENPQAMAHAEAKARGWPYIMAEHIPTSQGFVFRFGAASKLEAIARVVLSRHKEKRFICEQIHNTQEGGADCPCRVYFDIDGTLKGENSLDAVIGFIPSKKTFLTTSLDAIIKCLMDNYGVTVQYDDFLVSDSSVEGHKYSFHLLLPYKFDNMDARREFKLQIVDAEWGPEGGETVIAAVDEKVYTMNRNMRCLFNAKRDTPTRVFRPLNKLGDLTLAQWPEDEAEQLITSLVINYHHATTDEEFESLPPPKDPRRGWQQRRIVMCPLDGGGTTGNDGQGASLSYRNTLETEMRSILEQKHHRGPFIFTWIGATRVLVKTGPRRCPSGHLHDSDRFEIEVRPRGTTDVHPGGLDFVYDCCWTSQACKGKKVWLGSTSAKWKAPREQYSYEVEGRGPAVRPYPFDQYDTIVEGSTCGLGKTMQAKVMILINYCGDLPYDSRLNLACGIFDIETEGVGKAVLKYSVNESIRKHTGLAGAFGPDAENTKKPRVLIIVHRISLAEDIYYKKNFKALGFKLYRGEKKNNKTQAAQGDDDEEDEDEDDSQVGELVEEEKKEEAALVFESDKLIICVNSIHRIPVDKRHYDCLIVDECEEIFSALTTVNARSVSGAKWALYTTLFDIFRDSGKRLLMSAHAETYTDIFLRHVGEEKALWCENKVSKLKGNVYEFYHTFEDNDATARIEQFISDGKRLAIPCAERRDLERVHEHLTKKFPHKSFLAVHGALADKEKGAAFDAMTENRYDAVLYTATVDCGVSVDKVECDIVFARINHRSIRPKQIMQLLHRFRHVVDKLFILSFSCSPATVDWTRFPGYSKVTDLADDAETAVVIDMPSKQRLERQGKQFLFNNHDSHAADLYKVVSGSTSVLLRRNKQPPEPSASDVYDQLLRPMALDMGVVKLKTPVIKEIFAGYPGIQAAIDSGLEGHAPLVAMMVASAVEKDGLARSMVNELARLVALQGSPIRHCYQTSTLPARADVLHDNDTVLSLREVWAVGNAAMPDLHTMRAMGEKTDMSDDEKNQLTKAHVVATYGNYDLSKLAALEADLEAELEKDAPNPEEKARLCKAVKDLANALRKCLEPSVMKKYRDVSNLLKRVDGGAAGFKARLDDLFVSRAESNVAAADGPLPFASTEDHGKEAENCTLLSIAATFGFDDPFKQIDQQGELDLPQLAAALKNHGFATAKKKTKASGGGPVVAARTALAAWSLSPVQKKLSGAKKRAKKRSRAATEKDETDETTKVYTLKRLNEPWAALGVEPKFAAAERYAKFLKKIRSKPDDEDDEAVARPHRPLLFEGYSLVLVSEPPEEKVA